MNIFLSLTAKIRIYIVTKMLVHVMEIKYFEFYCKSYYFYEHLELKMILSTKYLDNLRPFTKQVKNDKEKQWKKFEADVWKVFSVWLLTEWNHIILNIN